VAELPDWFVARDYRYLRDLEANGWLKELLRCAHLNNEAARKKVGETTYLEEWEDIVGKELTDGFVPGFIGPPPVEVVEKADQAALHAIERPALIVQVWLGATDADIMAAFERVLRDARKTHPSPLKKRGPSATTGRFGKTEFDRWQTHKIVEISELFEWAAREGVKITNADLGRWLFAGYADPDKAAYDAQEVLRQAIGSIRALWAQVNRVVGVTDNQAELS
jgi:hypothetical protein